MRDLIQQMNNLKLDMAHLRQKILHEINRVLSFIFFHTCSYSVFLNRCSTTTDKSWMGPSQLPILAVMAVY